MSLIPHPSSYLPLSSRLSSPHASHSSSSCLSYLLFSGEMLCPLCKSLVNTLVPHVPSAAAKLLARRSAAPAAATAPLSTTTSLSTTTTAMLLQPPDSSSSSSSLTLTLSSILALPFVPQDWYRLIQQCQLLPSPTPSSATADSGTASTTSPLQRYYAQGDIASFVSTYDQALQGLCGTSPPLPPRHAMQRHQSPQQLTHILLLTHLLIPTHILILTYLYLIPTCHPCTHIISSAWQRGSLPLAVASSPVRGGRVHCAVRLSRQVLGSWKWSCYCHLCHLYRLWYRLCDCDSRWFQ